MGYFSIVPASVQDWMASTWLHTLVVGYAWTWPMLETMHFLGMCVMFGPIILMDLRLVGFDRNMIPVAAVQALAPLTVIGFAINVTTGIMFMFGDPYRYAINVSFQLKMLFVLIAGANALFFWLAATPIVERAGPNAEPPRVIKAIGLTSLLAWTAVLCFGRLIPYLGTG